MTTDGIVELSSRYAAGFPGQWYEIATQEHFWMEWRLRALRRLMHDVGAATNRGLKVLDIGCGHGAVRRQLEGCTAWTVDGCDLNRAGLLLNRTATGTTYLYDIHDRLPAMARSYDVLFLFDILEHIATPRSFVESAVFHLVPGGLVFVNVPALGALMSRYDQAAGHLRRYTLGSLTAELESVAGVRVELGRYWGFSLVPLLFVRKYALAHRQKDPATILRKGFRPPHRLVNGALKTLMHLETRLMPRPPLGTSVVAVARWNG